MEFDTPTAQAGQPQPGTKPRQVSEDGSGGESACERACDALASMKRAADRVSVLDGDRCPSARERVTKATQRVTARCRTCET